MKNLKRTLSLVLCLALLLGLLPNSLTVFAAEDTRDVINEVNITMPGLSDMPVDGAVVADPTYTVSPNYITVQYANWRIKSGSTWGVTGSRFTEGTYRYQFTLDLNTHGEHSKFADNLVVKVNGVPCGFLEAGNTSGEAIASGYVTDNGTKVVVCTPEYTAVPGPLVFVDDPALDIPEHVAGTGKYISKSFEVYGGTKPYTFSKVSGPEWITVAADGGTIGGVPTVVGSNSDLVVRVTDSSSPAQSQEITIHVGDTKPGVGAVTITNPISELQKPGSHQYNATVVTYGAGDEIIWSLAGGTDSTISASGLLTVGVNETATSLTITATSAADNTKSDKNIVYIKDYFVVDSVEVSPKNATVNTTKTLQFTANVFNDLDYPISGEQVTWAVSGGTDSTISNTGLLSVGVNESATTLTVTATSVTDPTKSDSVQVTVKQQKFQVILRNQGVLYAEYTVAEGKKVAKPTDPTRTGYTFGGWYQDETFTDIWDFENDTVTGNTDLYAKWTPVGSVTQVNHVALTGAPAKYEIGKTVGDYPLTGLSVSTGEVQLAGGAMWMATNTATPGMYDLSEPLNGSTVFTAFDSSNPRYFVVASAVMAKDGFDLSDSMTATVDGAEAIVLVINAGGVKGAYILLPYDPATGNRPDASAPTTYTVTFDSNGGSAVTAQSVQEGQTATEPAAPTKAGYTFMGWTRNKNPYDFSSPVTGNITVYARWGTTYNVSAIPALDSGDSLVDDDLDAYFPASSSYKYLQNTPYWKWYDPSIPNGIAVSGVNYYAYTIMYLEDYSAVPYEGDFVVKYAGTELSKLSSTEIYQDNMKSGYRIYMFDTYNVALQVRIFVGAPIGTGATYNIISGANSVYQKGSAVDKLTFTADGDSSDFLGVEVDGSLIDVGKYDTEVGGTTIIKLRKAYLESLSVGEHTLRIRYHDGAAPTKFTVVDEEPVPADYTIEVSLNGYSLGAKVADAYVSESSDTVDFYDFNDDGTFFCIFEDDGTGQSDWGSTVTQFEADKDYWLVVALTKQGGGALPETGLDADNATLRNGCVDKYSVYDDDLWWVEFKLNRLSESLAGVYSIIFDANGGSVTPESATTGNDGKLTSLPTPTHTSPSMAFDGWYTGKTGDIKVTTDTVFTSDTTIYAHWNVDYTIEVTLNGYELGKKVADITLAESSDSLDLDLENCHIFTDEDGAPDWSSEVTEFEAGVEYWLVVALTKQGGEELTSADLSADDVDLTNDHTAELMDYDDDLWWVSYKLKPLEATTPTFDIWVGGVGMVSGDYLHEGASAVSSAAPTDSSVGYAYYNDGVLTLHNYDYSGAPALDIDGSTDYYAVYRDGDLKVVLDGENSLILTAEDLSSSAGILADDLTVEKGSGSGKLTISGAGFGMVGDAVTINSGTFDIDVNYAAILAMMNITIENGEYELTAESWGCIYSYDGIVTIENGEFVLASENGAGMYSDGSIHIKNGTFEIDADTGIASVDILIEDGTLTIDAECGMDVYSEEDQPTSITIKGGNLSVTAKEDGLCAWEGSIDIQGGEMEIKSTDTENDEAYAAFYADSITIADTLSVLASTVPEGSDPEVYDKSQNSTYDWVKTGPIVQTTYTATVEHGTGAGEYAAGETVTIEAEELDGKLFREWTSQDGVTFADSKSAATTFTMPGQDVTVTATYDTIVTVIDISGITPPVVGEMPNDSFVVSTPGVELGAEIFWSRYEEATNKLIQTYEDDKLVNNEPFRAGYYVKLQTEVWAKEGYVFTPDTIIRYNGVELPVMDNTDLKPNFRYPILDARKYRTAASIGWEVVEAEPVDIQIPVTKVVQKGGNTDFSGRETFRFAVKVLNSNVDAGALSIIGDTMIVTDKNGQETVITITVPGEMFADVIDEGFLITEIKGTAQGWTYDETQWIAVYDEETGWKFVPYDKLFGDVEPEFQDEVTFTNVYTKNVEEPKQEESKPSAPAVNPQAPQTGDNSPVALWSSMMVISVLCAAVVVFGKKRFSVK